jgi:nucleoside-diphosphate-sugar epimerase
MNWASSTVLVTGTSGFVGQQVLDALEGVGSIVVAGRRAPQPAAGGTSCRHHVHLDLLAPDIQLPAGIDLVIHIAGEKHRPELMDGVNHLGTRQLADAAARGGVRRFVYLSSVGSYGAGPHVGVVTERFAHSPRNHYERSKDAGETSVRAVAARSGMEAIILQPSNVMGWIPGKSYPLLGLMKMIQRGHFTWFGGAETPWVNYVAVEDVAAAVVAAARVAPGGDYIINTPAALRDVVGWIADELGQAFPERTLPCWVGEVAASLGSTLTRVTGRALPFQRERFLELTNTNRYDSARLLGLPFQFPVGVEKLVRGLVQRYRSEGLL